MTEDDDRVTFLHDLGVECGACDTGVPGTVISVTNEGCCEKCGRSVIPPMRRGYLSNNPIFHAGKGLYAPYRAPLITRTERDAYGYFAMFFLGFAFGYLLAVITVWR